MLLTIDVGNTQTHIGAYRGEELLEHWRFATRREATGDELATTLVGLLALRRFTLDDVDGAIVSSVVPQLAHEYERVSERYFAGTLMVVGPGAHGGRTAGDDRTAAAPRPVAATPVRTSPAACAGCGRRAPPHAARARSAPVPSTGSRRSGRARAGSARPARARPAPASPPPWRDTGRCPRCRASSSPGTATSRRCAHCSSLASGRPCTLAGVALPGEAPVAVAGLDRRPGLALHLVEVELAVAGGAVLLRLRVLRGERLGDVLELLLGRLDAQHDLHDPGGDHQHGAEQVAVHDVRLAAAVDQLAEQQRPGDAADRRADRVEEGDRHRP